MEKRLFAISHIVYEIDTMVTATLRHREIEDAGGDWIERNINLESALLHARALIEFLVRKSGRDDYMFPSDFGSGWDTSQCREVASQLGALNAHLAHLTWTRLDKDAPRVSRTLIYDVLTDSGAFASYLKKNGRLGWQAIEEAIAEAKRLAESRGGLCSGTIHPPFTTADTRVSVVGGRRPLELDLDISLTP